jgi:hypothetical protein
MSFRRKTCLARAANRTSSPRAVSVRTTLSFSVVIILVSLGY